MNNDIETLPFSVDHLNVRRIEENMTVVRLLEIFRFRENATQKKGPIFRGFDEIEGHERKLISSLHACVLYASSLQASSGEPKRFCIEILGHGFKTVLKFRTEPRRRPDPDCPECRGSGIRRLRRAHEEGYDVVSQRCPCTDGPAITGEHMSKTNSETTVGENVGSIYLTTATASELAREFEHRMMELERAYETVQETSNAEADLYSQRIAELARERDDYHERWNAVSAKHEQLVFDSAQSRHALPVWRRRATEAEAQLKMLREENAELREAMRQEVQRLADSAGLSTT